jgi:glycosyltransferase involved in cell wall biosynthesis
MYFIPIIVPIFVQGDRKFVHSDWKRALRLLRDSLEGRYGDLLVAAPWLPVEAPRAREQVLEEIDAHEGIELQPLFDWRVRARVFWLHELKRIRSELETSLARATVVHGALDDLFRPMIDVAVMGAFRRDLPTIVVQDTDVVTQFRQLPNVALGMRARDVAYSVVYERVGRHLVAHADLSLLKGKELMRRYAGFAKNPREFHNTSYLASEVSAESRIAERLATLVEPRPLRLVYCGRLVARKGVDDSIRIVERARHKGANVTLDVIGCGPAETALSAQIAAAGLAGIVRLSGTRAYGPSLLRELAGYDAMFFTPTAEDTPRMIFDGYAAGLPMIGAAIPYVCERADEDGTAILLPRRDIGAAAECLLSIDANRERLTPLTRAALSKARYHAADSWYKRRAEWTHAAVDAKVATRRRRKPSAVASPPPA